MLLLAEQLETFADKQRELNDTLDTEEQVLLLTQLLIVGGAETTGLADAATSVEHRQCEPDSFRAISLE